MSLFIVYCKLDHKSDIHPNPLILQIRITAESKRLRFRGNYSNNMKHRSKPYCVLSLTSKQTVFVINTGRVVSSGSALRSAADCCCVEPSYWLAGL